MGKGDGQADRFEDEEVGEKDQGAGGRESFSENQVVERGKGREQRQDGGQECGHEKPEGDGERAAFQASVFGDFVQGYHGVKNSVKVMGER